MLIPTFYLICKNPSTKEGIKQDNCKLAIWPVKPPHHPGMTSDPRVKNFRNLSRDLLHQRICTCNCPVVYKVFEEAIHFINTWKSILTIKPFLRREMHVGFFKRYLTSSFWPGSLTFKLNGVLLGYSLYYILIFFILSSGHETERS